MSKNDTNSPSLWNSLLSNQKYLDDSGKIVFERIKFATLNLLKNEPTLNIGTGQGFLEKELFRNRYDFSKYITLDISIEGLKRLAKIGCNRVVGSACNLPFKKNTFNQIVCMEVLEHFSLEIVAHVYSEIKRVSTKNTNFIFTIPVYEPLPLKNHPVGHYRKYVPQEFFDELEDNQFKIIKIKYLYAFNNLYNLKSKFAEITSLRRPSVVAVVCKRT